MANYDIAKLDALNAIGEDGTLFDDNLVGSENACASFVKRVATNITNKDLVDTGKILDITVQKQDENTINIVGQKYILILDKGIQGAERNTLAPQSPYKMKKMPPVETFVDWINRKNIRLRNNEAYGGSSDEMVDDTKVEQVAYAMALERYRKGYAPQDIFEKEIPQLIDDAGIGVANAVVNKFFKSLDDLDKL